MKKRELIQPQVKPRIDEPSRRYPRHIQAQLKHCFVHQNTGYAVSIVFVERWLLFLNLHLRPPHGRLNERRALSVVPDKHQLAYGPCL